MNMSGRKKAAERDEGLSERIEEMVRMNPGVDDALLRSAQDALAELREQGRMKPESDFVPPYGSRPLRAPTPLRSRGS
jgi:hypothetical protein